MRYLRLRIPYRKALQIRKEFKVLFEDEHTVKIDLGKETDALLIYEAGLYVYIIAFQIGDIGAVVTKDPEYTFALLPDDIPIYVWYIRSKKAAQWVERHENIIIEPVLIISEFRNISEGDFEAILEDLIEYPGTLTRKIPDLAEFKTNLLRYADLYTQLFDKALELLGRIEHEKNSDRGT